MRSVEVEKDSVFESADKGGTEPGPADRVASGPLFPLLPLCVLLLVPALFGGDGVRPCVVDPGAEADCSGTFIAAAFGEGCNDLGVAVGWPSELECETINAKTHQGLFLELWRFGRVGLGRVDSLKRRCRALRRQHGAPA
jgi:hypothetical protein